MGAFAGLRRRLGRAIRCIAVAALAGTGAVQEGGARGPVVASVDTVRIGTYDDFTRVLMHVSVPVSPKLYTLSGPDRLIVDLPRIDWRMPRLTGAVRSRLIHRYSYGLHSPSVSRLVFYLNGPAQIVDFDVAPLLDKVGYELDIRLTEPDFRPFDRYRLANGQKFRADGTPVPGADHGALPEAPVVDEDTRETFRSRHFDPRTAEYGALGALFAAVEDAPEGPSDALPEDEEIEIVIADPLVPEPRGAGEAPEGGFPDALAEAPGAAASPQPRAGPDGKGDKVALMAKAAPNVLAPDGDPIVEPKRPGRASRRPFRVVIDPGHGGRDPGAGTQIGLREASAVLAFSEELMALLEADPNYRAFATRRTDTFVELPDRVRFAREKQANLFISIHADWFDDPGIGGAGAYMLSEEDSIRSIDELVTKKRASKVAGIDIRKEREDVVRVLLDLERRETQVGSRLFAEMVRDKLAEVTPLKRNFMRHDNFHVLKAPDMPSVLLELGFMSNPEDRERLASPEWRRTTAAALKKAIDAWRIERGNRELASR